MVPSMLTMTSPVLMPARAAGPPEATFATSAPLGRLSPRLSAISGVTSCSLAPSQGRLTAALPPRAEATTTLHHVGRNRKSDALRAARARIDRGIDADQFAGQVDQRAAGIARIDRRVSLDEEAVIADADLGARHRRNDAVRYRLADAERIADRQHHVAHLQLIGIGEFQRRKALADALEPQHREVAVLVLECNLGVEFALVGKRDLHFTRALDHVVIGHD